MVAAATIGVFCLNPLYSNENDNQDISHEQSDIQDDATLVAGSKKLPEEERSAIKQKRSESTEEDVRGEVITNDMYLTTHPAASHGIIKATPYYDRVYLNDGSIWQVYYDMDRSVISNWMYYNDQVIVCPASIFDPTDYILVSQRTYETVCVNLSEMEVLIGDPYYMGQRLWISHVDYFYDIVYGRFFYNLILSDGSAWEVSTSDDFLCVYFRPGDVVFVGVDESFNSPTYNILIHFNTLEYVHADCVAK